MTAALLLPILLLTLLTIEAIVLRARRARIPVRIHVSGTRGKSTVVRYICAGLRSGGKRTLGKITGVSPTLLLPDGSSSPIRRRGIARVQEQVRSIMRAGSMQCDALVLECMSVEPSLQRFEADVISPTIAVLTNLREDHQEVFQGLSVVEGVAAAAVASRCAVLIAPDAVLEAMHVQQPPGRSRDVDDMISQEVGEDQRENIGLALRACIEAGVPSDVALEAIRSELSSSAPKVQTWIEGGITRSFIDGFAVNDVESADQFIRARRESGSLTGGLYLILNTRADRPLRTNRFTSWVASRDGVRGVIITGTHREFCRRSLVRKGVAPDAVKVWGTEDVLSAPRRCAELTDGPATFVGIMNIAGDGFRIRDAFATKGIVDGH